MTAPAKTLDGHGFLKVVSRAEFAALLSSFAPLASEDCALGQALGRVLARDVAAPEDLPRTARACMDGYALSARDVFGATETNPAYVDCVADLRIDWAGGAGGVSLKSGQAARIPTGGSLPEGADAVVMVEHTGELGANAIEVRKTAAPGENVMLPGEDVRASDIALPAGRTLRAQDIGLLAALGVMEIGVGRRPRVGVLSTGDELVPAEATPRPGQIRDVNASALCCLAHEAGAEAVALGIVPDDLPRLTQALASALERCDVVLVSGGSSLGARDHSVAAMQAQPGAEILAHGIAMSPGKPTILARAGGKAILGLPGQVTSAQVVMAVLVKPFLRHLAGDASALSVAPPPFLVELARNIASRPGREDFVRVRLEARPGAVPLAHPVLGKSGLLKTLLDADGLVAVPANAEGLYKGALAPVHLL
ncbi:MAG: molybdopterin molybdotransferase MoeA [Humidesulfovibrio sp.]|uniref:molybdopterin molybdotransferase MoeA n=1 Tax=Humidesulfovibrio sp. TaxID=2910988 RepID=UPI0027F48C1C|nr:gephyrin-like molybdotransferase Glp [Humidesulfovibrio sp.]MDQ7836691.1 molybdopterin molybdotransferase MoeA [Humidesulfovibrio sp.]